MAKLKVMSIEIAAPVSKKDAVTEYLQRRAVTEISMPEDTGSLSFSEFSEENAENSKKSAVVKNAKNILEKEVPLKTSLLQTFNGRKEISDEEYRLLSSDFERVYKICESIIELDRQKNEYADNVVKYQARIDELSPWVKSDIPLKSEKFKRTAYITGSFRKKISEDEIYSLITSRLPEEVCAEVYLSHIDENMTCALVISTAKDIDKIENVLKSEGFSNAPECNADCAEEEISFLKEKMSKALTSSKECREKISSFAAEREKIDFILDSLRISSDKIKATEKMPENSRVFYIKGYIAQRDADKTKAYLEKKCDAAVSISEPQESEDVPVILSNNFFAAPLENITGMYSLPGKYDPDPTGVMAFFYYFFFGMMLSDAGYGLLMVIATGSMLLFNKKLEKKTKNMCLMYLFCGLSTVFWGAMYGSWFGDMINVVRTEFLSLPEIRLYIWMEPVNSLMELMVYCFLFGLVHLFTGVAVKAVSDWKNGDKKAAFCDSIPTYLTVLGIAPIFFGLFTDVPPILSKIGTPVLIAGLILVILTGGRNARSIGGKIGGGLYEVYNLIGGYLGDVLSYARLLALGLSTGVIAEVMNMLGVLPENRVLKIIMFCVVAVVGHIANFAINVIGAYVHTNRLQYVEFFGKFYEGGGRAFVPFKADTEYYKFKEEN